MTRKLTDKQREKRKRERERRIEDRMLTACGAYLKMRGWNPLVIGVRGVGGRPTSEYHFDLVLGFTGKNPNKEPAP